MRKAAEAAVPDQVVSDSTATAQAVPDPVVSVSAVPADALTADRPAVSGPPLRRGKWTPEEEAYANRLIQEFKSGLLPLTDGTSPRTFLSKLLKCDPMRITKKFAGNDCIGKQVYRRWEFYFNRLTPEQILQSRAELGELERRFFKSIVQTNRAKSSGKKRKINRTEAATSEGAGVNKKRRKRAEVRVGHRAKTGNCGVDHKATSGRGLPLGVTLESSGKFASQICWRGKQRYIGSFDTPEQASAVYAFARKGLDDANLLSFRPDEEDDLFDAAKKKALETVQAIIDND